MTPSADAPVQARSVGALFWVLAAFGVALASILLALLTVFWQIDCPGAAELSAQHRVCDRVGAWGGPALMACGLALALAVVVPAARLAARRSGGRLPAWVLLAAVLAPVVGVLVSQQLLTAPSDDCTAARKREQALVLEQWRISGESRGEPRPVDGCVVTEGS